MITKSFRMTAVAALLCGVSAMAVAAVTAGTYEGAAQGKLSTVKAAVTLNQDGRITDVKLDVSGETPELGGAAAKKMAPAIVEHQSTAVRCRAKPSARRWLRRSRRPALIRKSTT